MIKKISMTKIEEKKKMNSESNKHQFTYRDCKITIRKGNLIEQYV